MTGRVITTRMRRKAWALLTAPLRWLARAVRKAYTDG